MKSNEEIVSDIKEKVLARQERDQNRRKVMISCITLVICVGVVAVNASLIGKRLAALGGEKSAEPLSTQVADETKGEQPVSITVPISDELFSQFNSALCYYNNNRNNLNADVIYDLKVLANGKETLSHGSCAIQTRQTEGKLEAGIDQTISTDGTELHTAIFYDGSYMYINDSHTKYKYLTENAAFADAYLNDRNSGYNPEMLSKAVKTEEDGFTRYTITVDTAKAEENYNNIIQNLYGTDPMIYDSIQIYLTFDGNNNIRDIHQQIDMRQPDTQSEIHYNLYMFFKEPQAFELPDDLDSYELNVGD